MSRKHVRRFSYPADQAHQDIADLRAPALHATSTADLIASALEMAIGHDITAYDACYVALAQELKVPFVTADEALIRKLAGSPYDVQWLGSLTIPPPPES